MSKRRTVRWPKVVYPYPSTKVVVHGIEVDSITRIASLPPDKLCEARSELSLLLRKHKTRIRELQSVIGFLNFACRVIRCGRAFLRRLIALIIGVTNKNYFIKITPEARKDLRMWLYLLEHLMLIAYSLNKFGYHPTNWNSLPMVHPS